MYRLTTLLALVLVWWVSPAPAEVAERRVALVMGNGAYRHVAPLPNPANDARAMAAALRRLGFEVTEATDLDRQGMEDALLAFARAAENVDDALMFYAGHGIQVDGENYLLPIDTRLEDERDLRRDPAASQLIRNAAGASRVALVILDACRDNPFARILARRVGTRSVDVGRGLAPPGATPPNTLIAYATAADAVAVDAMVAGGGITPHSPFTAALLRYLEQPGLEVRLLFGKVRDAVAEATNGTQVPFTYGSLGATEIYLARAVPGPAATVAATPAAPTVRDLRALDGTLTAVERRAIQTSLRWLGYYEGPDDATMNYRVRAAIREFQLSIGEPGTGYLTPRQMVELHRLANPVRPPHPLWDQMTRDEVIAKSEAGDLDAQMLRGQYHDTWFEDGGLPKDNAEAARWYRRAAEAGHVIAAVNLGWLIKDGDGVERDDAEALRWLRVGAEAGHPWAQYALGEMYAEGWGVPPDEAEASRLFRLAARDDYSPGIAPAAMAYLRALNAWTGPPEPIDAARLPD